MSKSDRNAPRIAGGSESRYTFYDFDREFPDDASCLEWLVDWLYPNGITCPKCQKVTKHHRIAKRPAYACQNCGHHEYPLVGTIFENSATSLRLWFHAFFLMAQTRCGISAKQLERELGVTYKTAWRMFNKIRSLLADDDDHYFTGPVEIDEAWFGGRGKWQHGTQRRGHPTADSNKMPVVGMVNRKVKGRARSRVVAQVVSEVRDREVLPLVSERVFAASKVYTDDGSIYQPLTRMGYDHDSVNHSAKVYVAGDVHVNTIEGFWSLVKRGITGVYHGVGPQHLQSYLDEYAFRYNNRDAVNGRGMFGAFLSRIEKVSG